MTTRPGRAIAAVVALVGAVGLLVVAVVAAWAIRPQPTGASEPDAEVTISLGEPSGGATPHPADPTEPAPRTADIVMSGDLLWHNTVWFSAAEDHARTGVGARFDFDPAFAAMKPVVESADVAICHEEVPFAAPGDKLRSYPVFAAPPAIAPWIGTMGWDACTTASNHSMDAGVDGILRTADLLDAAGVAHVGSFRSPEERRTPVIITTDQGVKVGIVAATYGLNGYVLPSGQEWAVSQLGDTDDLHAQAARARAAGADIVVAHVHWGTEYDHLPDATQTALAQDLTADPDIDLVLGEHAHVVQPITRVNGTWVVYGMGNMIAQNDVTTPDAYEGITVEFGFTQAPDGTYDVTRAAYVPTQWNHYARGNPIRIVGASGEHLASIRSAVNGLGHNAGLIEDSLP
ncbi:CapA family protein [Nocardioides sp. CN2-186]|uniref:CapA family protein n=1 Tax=Nocardioides tweenelious TaxID=3156607 RepID=UPI0032B3C5F1